MFYCFFLPLAFMFLFNEFNLPPLIFAFWLTFLVGEKEVTPILVDNLNLTVSSTAHSEMLEYIQPSWPINSKRGLASGFKIIVPAKNPQPNCGKTLMEYSFQSGSPEGPYSFHYTPPLCDFKAVVLNLTVRSEGVRSHQLGLVYLNNTEIWRTSTVVGDPDDGVISWRTWRDMSTYMSLWKKEQTLTFDFDPPYHQGIGGIMNMTIYATFFANEGVESKPLKMDPPSLVMPISAPQSGKNRGGAFRLPAQDASVQVSLPRNTYRAIVSVAATGREDDESWQTNVPDRLAAMAPGARGGSAFREIQLVIDNHIAGIVWPFPLVLPGGGLGGGNNLLSRSMVGIQAFDILESQIDITPWLAVLCDGLPHTLRLQVQAGDGKPPNSYWLVSGKVFVWESLNHPFKTTTGEYPKVVYKAPPLITKELRVDNGADWASLQEQASSLTVKARIVLAGYKHSSDFSWMQVFNMSNKHTFPGPPPKPIKALAGGRKNKNKQKHNYEYDQDIRARYSGFSCLLENAGVMDLKNEPLFWTGFDYIYHLRLSSSDDKRRLGQDDSNRTNSSNRGNSQTGRRRVTAKLRHGMRLDVTGPSNFDLGLDALARQVPNWNKFFTGPSIRAEMTSFASWYVDDENRTAGAAPAVASLRDTDPSWLQANGSFQLFGRGDPKLKGGSKPLELTKIAGKNTMFVLLDRMISVKGKAGGFFDRYDYMNIGTQRKPESWDEKKEAKLAKGGRKHPLGGKVFEMQGV